MAKRKKLLPARKPPGQSRNEEALSIRSAESLGRVIGTLQRQLDHAIHRFTGRPVHRPATTGEDADVGDRAVRRTATRAPRPAATEPPAARRSKAAVTKKTTRASRVRSTKTTAKRAARPK